MCAKIFSRPVKKVVLLGIFLLALFIILVPLCLTTPLPINLLGGFLRIKSDINLNAKGFILRPGLKGRIDQLYIDRDNGVLARAQVARIDFDGKIGHKLKPAITDLVIHGPEVALKIKRDFLKASSSSRGQLKSFESPFPLQDYIKKMPHVKRMDVEGGTFFIQLPNETGILKLTDIKIQAHDMGPDKGGEILLEGGLHICLSSNESCPPGQMKLSLQLKSLSPVVSGTGHLSLWLPKIMAKGILLRDLTIEAPILIDSHQFYLGALILSFKGLEIKKDTIPALYDSKIQANIAFDIREKILNFSMVKAELPGMGILEGDLKMLLQDGLSWKGSLYAKDFLLTNIPDIIDPFIELSQRGWSLNGRGKLKARLEGKWIDKKWDLGGGVELEVREGGFSSPDGTKAGDEINMIINLNLAYPKRQDERITLETKGRIEGGEYLWDTVYRDLSGRSLSWEMDSFFLQVPKG